MSEGNMRFFDQSVSAVRSFLLRENLTEAKRLARQSHRGFFLPGFGWILTKFRLTFNLERMSDPVRRDEDLVEEALTIEKRHAA